MKRQKQLHSATVGSNKQMWVRIITCSLETSQPIDETDDWRMTQRSRARADMAWMLLLTTTMVMTKMTMMNEAAVGETFVEQACHSTVKQKR
jgi:hypothetical protein